MSLEASGWIRPRQQILAPGRAFNCGRSSLPRSGAIWTRRQEGPGEPLPGHGGIVGHAAEQVVTVSLPADALYYLKDRQVVLFQGV